MPYGEHTRTYGLGINLQFGGLFRLNPIFQVMFDCNNGIDPKYGLGDADYTCASTTNYATLCSDDTLLDATYFDGATYGEPSLVSGDGKVVELTFALTGDDYLTPQMIVEGRTADASGVTSGFMEVSASTGLLNYSSYENVRVNGILTPDDTLKIIANKVYHISFSLSSTSRVASIGARGYTSSLYFTGFMKDLIIYDTDGKTKLHHYPLSSIGNTNGTLTFEDIVNPDSKQPELWSNPTLGTQWTDNGNGSYTLVGDGNFNTLSSPVSSIGDRMVSSFVVDSFSGVGSLKFQNSIDNIVNASAVGVYPAIYVADGPNAQFARSAPDDTITVTISSISVKQTYSGQYTGTPSIRSLPKGTIVTADIDEPKIHMSESVGVLLEGEATNLTDTDLEGVFWDIGSCVVSVSDIPSPSGALNAYKVENLGGTNRVWRNNAVSDGYNKSIYARTVSGTGQTCLLKQNSVLGALVTLTEEWQRFDLPTDTSEALGAAFYVVDFRNLANTLDEVLVWTPNATALPFPTSPIYGAANTVRAPTNLTYDASGNFNPSLFSIEVEFDVMGLVGSSVLQSVVSIVNSGNLNNRIKIMISTGVFTFQIYDGTSVHNVTSSVTPVPYTKYKTMLVFDGVDYIFIIDGVEVARVAKVASPTGINEIRVGHYNTTQQLYGTVSSLKIYDYDVTNPPKNSELPKADTQPVNQSVADAAPYSFTVTSSNTVSYEWQVFDGSTWEIASAYTGYATASLSGTANTGLNGYKFRCNMTNTFGTKLSQSAELEVV